MRSFVPTETVVYCAHVHVSLSSNECSRHSHTVVISIADADADADAGAGAGAGADAVARDGVTATGTDHRLSTLFTPRALVGQFVYLVAEGSNQ
ncbi:unnamed protein product [Toxocara canis]|uniref:Uncharacterized protein n=1 Tax=Toxocara canis TaxID=6265 RepID=A0A183V8B7_TOXCA|nr:unnamed protein product [Toxocara canis]